MDAKQLAEWFAKLKGNEDFSARFTAAEGEIMAKALAAYTSPRYVQGEAIPVADILAEIEHIRENGLSLAKFGGVDVDEGRCRELCAMYLREFIVSKRWGDELRKLDAADTISHGD